MRFIFVYHTYHRQLSDLVASLGVVDVAIIVARKDSEAPNAEEMDLLIQHKGAQAAACQIDRKYRKSIAQVVDLCCEPKKFRVEDQLLRDWLVPPEKAVVQFNAPSISFAAAAGRAADLVLHASALNVADQIRELRWPFISRAADILARIAGGEDCGPMREWKAKYAVDYAQNGRIVYKYTINSNGKNVSGETQWHLKDGDRTEAAGAARVYFAVADVSNVTKVLVFYVGPHPADGTYRVDF